MKHSEGGVGVTPSHDATHEMKLFPGKEHARPEDESYENKRNREPDKEFKPLEQMSDTSGLSDPEFLAAMRELREKIGEGTMKVGEINIGEIAQEFGVDSHMVEDMLFLREEEVGASEKPIVNDPEYYKAESYTLREKKQRTGVKEIDRSELPPVHGGTAVQEGVAKRYKMPGARNRRAIRKEQLPEQQT